MSAHVISIRPRYGEVDRMGFVYHAHYLVYFELGRTEAMRARGMPYAGIEDRGHRLVVAEARLKFVLPSHYDEDLTLTTTVERVGGASVTFAYVLAGADGQVRTTGSTRLGCVDAQGQACRLPSDLAAALA